MFQIYCISIAAYDKINESTLLREVRKGTSKTELLTKFDKKSPIKQSKIFISFTVHFAVLNSPMVKVNYLVELLNFNINLLIFVQMKLLIVVAFLVASSLTVEAKSLAEAMHEWSNVWALHSWGIIWNVRIGSDAATCALANQLNSNYAPAFAVIENHPLGVDFRRRMSEGGVDWETYKNNELKPAIGVHPIVSPCTTINDGGVEETRRLLYLLFNKDEIQSSAARLRGESAEFNELYNVVAANQAGVTEIRCHPDVQVIYNIFVAHHFDVQMISEFVQMMFGFNVIGPC